MKKSKKLSVLYRLWASEIWEMIKEHLSGSYSWSYFDPGRLVFVKSPKGEMSRCVSLLFSEHTMIGLTFQIDENEEKKFNLPMQLVLENLDILKEFLNTCEIPKEESLIVLVNQFNESNQNYFEEELKYNIKIRPQIDFMFL